MPTPAPAASTGGAGAAVCATAGGASTCGRTHPWPGFCAAATAAAPPQSATAGAPPLNAVRTAQGLIWGAAVDAAAAPVEVRNNEPATKAPMTGLTRDVRITQLPPGPAYNP